MKINSTSFLRDLLIACLVFSLPFMYNLHKLAPNEKVWNTPFFSIASYHFDDVQYLLWIFANKAIIFIGCLIWYLTNRLWWRNVILIPMLLALIQILSLFDNSKTKFDVVEFYNVIPIAIILIGFIYWFGYKLKYYSLTQDLEKDLNIEIDREIDKLKEGKGIKINHIRDRLTELKMNKEAMQSSEYLIKLFELKKSISDS